MRIFLLLTLCTVKLVAQTWVQLPDFPGVRRDDGVAVLSGNTAYFGTGLMEGWIPATDFYALDLTTYTWKQIASMPAGAQRQYACAFTAPGSFYVFGGDEGGALNSMFRYNIAADSWSLAPAKPGAGLIGASGLQFSSSIIFVGGKVAAAGPVSKEVWEFNTATAQWKQKNDFPFRARWRASAAVLNQKGYFMFGLDDSSAYRKDVFSYDPLTDTWSQENDFPSGDGRAYCALNASANRLVLVAGHAEFNTYLSDVWYYSGGQWTTGPAFPALPRRGNMSCLAGDRFIMSCGLGKGDTRLKETWMMDVPLSAAGAPPAAGELFYPQPASGFVYIPQPANGGGRLQLCDATGKVVLSALLQEGLNRLDVAALQPGVYMLRIEAAGRMPVSKKFVKL